MLKKTFAKVALTGIVCSMGVAFLPLKEVSAADSFNASYANICDEKRVNYLPSYGSVKIGNYTVNNAFQYIKGNCSMQHYKYYGNTVFFRRNYGEGIPVYSTIPTNGAFTGNAPSDKDTWSWQEIKENAEDKNGWFKTWAVKLNTYSCRGNKTSVLVGGDACKADKLETPNDYQSYTLKNGGMVPNGSKVEIRVHGYSMDGYSLDNSYLGMDMTSSSATDDVWSSLGAFLKDKNADKNVFNTKHDWKQARTKYDMPNNKAQYQKKLDAIQRLIDLKLISGKPTDWVEMLSLKTDPTKEAAIFVATRYNGKGYISVTLPAPEDYRIRNMMVTKLEIYKGNTIYGTMTRDKDDGTIETKWHKNLTEGEKYKVRVTVTSTGGMAPQKNTHYIDYKGKTYTKNENIKLGGSVTIDNLDYTAPMNKDKDTIKVSLGSGYGTDNQIPGDDSGSIEAKIDQLPEGDLGVHNVHLIEAATGKSVAYPIQGREYYIKYEVKYTGNNMPQNNLFNIPINVKYHLYQSKTNSNKTIETTLYPTETNQQLTDGKIFTYYTNTFVAESSKITTDFTISFPKYDYDINTNSKNDSGSGKWEANFDIAVVPGSVTIQPGNYPGGDYCKPLVIKYKLQYNVPAGHTYNEAQTVTVAFNINGKVVTSKIQVYANQGQKEYSFTYNNGCINSSGNVPVQIQANPYRELHESNYGNNTLNKDWVKKQIAQNYCETVSHEKNTWTQKYYVISVDDAALGPDLDQFAGEQEYKISQKETLAITSVQFYSKYMKDKKWGDNRDGWVEVLNKDTGKQSTGYIPTIKAGYGFDIKVTVEYNTNAFTSEKEEIGKLNENQTLYAPHAITEFDDDMYLMLKTKGMSNTNAKVISAKGKNNQNGTSVKVSANSSGSVTDKLVMTYTFEDVRITEGTPDGFYYLSLYTKPIQGVVDKTEFSGLNDLLCDYLNIQFKVNGSIHDDVITGTIK